MGNHDHHEAPCTDQLKEGSNTPPSRELKCRTNKQHSGWNQRCNGLGKCRIHAVAPPFDVCSLYRISHWQPQVLPRMASRPSQTKSGTGTSATGSAHGKCQTSLTATAR